MAKKEVRPVPSYKPNPSKQIVAMILMIFAVYTFIHAIKIQFFGVNPWTAIMAYLIAAVFYTAARKLGFKC